MLIDFEQEQVDALIQMVNATTVTGADARLLVGILDKLENAEEKKTRKRKKV